PIARECGIGGILTHTHNALRLAARRAHAPQYRIAPPVRLEHDGPAIRSPRHRHRAPIVRREARWLPAPRRDHVYILDAARNRPEESERFSIRRDGGTQVADDLVGRERHRLPRTALNADHRDVEWFFVLRFVRGNQVLAVRRPVELPPDGF